MKLHADTFLLHIITNVHFHLSCNPLPFNGTTAVTEIFTTVTQATDMVNPSKLFLFFSLSKHRTKICSSVLMPAHKSNNQLLYSQLKGLRQATAMHEHSMKVLWIFSAELKPVFPYFVPMISISVEKKLKVSFIASEISIFTDNSHTCFIAADGRPSLCKTARFWAKNCD